MGSSTRGRRGAVATVAALLIGAIVWACTDDGHEGHDHGDAPVPPTSEAASISATPQVTGTGDPTPSGAVLDVSAPEGIVQGCALEVIATVSPVDPGNPLIDATLTVTDAGGALLFTGAPSALDPGTGTASWTISGDDTIAWPVGATLLAAEAHLGLGETAFAELGIGVAEGTLVIVIAGQEYRDGDTFELSCNIDVPYPTPSTPTTIGTPVPGGPMAMCNPVLTNAGINPPNLTPSGGPALTLSSTQGTAFEVTIESLESEASVTFSAAGNSSMAATITYRKAAPEEKEMLIAIEGIIFNFEIENHEREGMDLRRNGKKNPRADYPDDFATPAWTPSNEDRGVEDFDVQPFSLDTDLAKGSGIRRADQHNDSVALYPALEGDKTKKTVRVLFKLLKLTDSSFEPGGENANQRYFGAEIRVAGVAKPGFFDNGQEGVWFDLYPDRVPEPPLGTHPNDHRHSMGFAAGGAPGSGTDSPGPNDPRDPTRGTVPPGAIPAFQDPPDGRAEPKPGRDSFAIDHLHYHYLEFVIEVEAGALDTAQWIDESLQWEFYDWYQKKWVKCVVEANSGADGDPPPGITKHRFYSLPGVPIEPWGQVRQARKKTKTSAAVAAFRTDNVQLPWSHLLDELLKTRTSGQPSGAGGPPPAPLGPMGAIGGRAVRSLPDVFAADMTQYISRHDDPVWMRAARNNTYSYDPNITVNKGSSFVFPGPGKFTKYVKQGGRGDVTFDLSRHFFALFNESRWGEPRTEKLACYGLSAMNYLFCRTIGIETEIRIEQSREYGSIAADPLLAWGVWDDTPAVIKASSAESLRNPTEHAYLTIGEQTVFDALYRVKTGLYPRTVIAGESLFDYHVFSLRYSKLIGKLPKPPDPQNVPDRVRKEIDKILRNKESVVNSNFKIQRIR